ncbi:CHAT domain-containing protein [Streptomyces cyaneus]|uniref:CHAT domain-containing protein n=1 Tax=Streptomyces cyaneus TaxID=1904 RepID=UPI000FF881FF|nr:CHAT domain-containing protein [Streptomyces cyaneus]
MSAVLDGRLAKADAEEIIRSTAGAVDWSRRWAEVAHLQSMIDAAHSVDGVLVLTDLADAAAEPLGGVVRGQVLGSGALRLLELNLPEPALPLLERAVDLLADDELTQLEARRFRLRALVLLDRREEFFQDCPAVVASAERLGSANDLCMLLFDEATLAARSGDTVRALDQVRAACRVRARITSDRAGEILHTPARFAIQHALFARQAGQFEEALTALEDARSLALAADDRLTAAFALSEAGITWEMLGDVRRANYFLNDAAAEADRAGHRNWAGHWRHDLTGLEADGEEGASAWQRASAIMLRAPERAAEAVPLFRKAIADARRVHQTDLEADARNALGAALAQCKQPEQAEMALRAAIATARRSDDALREVRSRTNLARHLLYQTWVDEARHEIDQSIELGERLRDGATTVELSQNVAITLSRAYDTAIFMAAVLHQAGDDTSEGPGRTGMRPRPDALLELGQRARAATTTEALRVGRIVEEHADPELVSAMLDLRAAEAAVQLAAAHRESLTESVAERDRTAQRLERAADARKLTLAVSSAPVPTDELAAALAPQEVLVDLLTVPEGVVVTCLADTGQASARLIAWDESTRRRFLRRLQRAYRESLDPHPDEVDETRFLVREALRDLDTVLLGPVAETVESVCSRPPRRVLISPENELFHLPYWRLATRWENSAVSVLPTPGALPLLRARQRDGRRPWISVGDPSGTLPHAAGDVSAGLGYQDCAPEIGRLLATLPEAGRVHFACHGHFDAENSYLSGLEVLPSPSPDPLGARRTTASGSGLFTAAQITGRLHMPHCTLVVLSACTSGLSRLHAASEFTSLPGAFLVAGARNVVASLWPASDSAAALLMRAFYFAYEGSPSAALAAARERLATMSRAEAASLLDTDDLPPFDPPFADSMYIDCFQHYGVD